MASVESELSRLSSASKARVASSFFKTGKGEYGEGDVFIGVTVPEQRSVAKRHVGMGLGEVGKLLSSRVHEHRLTALLILVEKFRKSDAGGRKEIVGFYLKNLNRVNNWDLVDLSADKILGEYFSAAGGVDILKMAESKSVWERRVAIVSTFALIRRNRFGETLRISEKLLGDEHDLVHKAVGWMLREVGKRDKEAEVSFLKKHYMRMPRTMLRYAIERFPEKERNFFMRGHVMGRRSA